jgi:hypothetical protein
MTFWQLQQGPAPQDASQLMTATRLPRSFVLNAATSFAALLRSRVHSRALLDACRNPTQVTSVMTVRLLGWRLSGEVSLAPTSVQGFVHDEFSVYSVGHQVAGFVGVGVAAAEVEGVGLFVACDNC